MAKNDKIMCWLRKAWLGILILGVLIAIVAVYADLPEQVDTNTLQSTENKEAIIRIEIHYQHIQDKQNKQSDKLDRILERLP